MHAIFRPNVFSLFLSFAKTQCAKFSKNVSFLLLSIPLWDFTDKTTHKNNSLSKVFFKSVIFPSQKLTKCYTNSKYTKPCNMQAKMVSLLCPIFLNCMRTTLYLLGMIHRGCSTHFAYIKSCLFIWTSPKKQPIRTVFLNCH